jgi:hypothetical protein
MKIAKCKITEENIDSLEDNEVFVFGSNLSGIHGAGAARQAVEWGAVYGKGLGISGKTYALPTKDKSLLTLPLNNIRRYVNLLEMFIINDPFSHFLVTKVGCGLAGYTVEDIAPLFSHFTDIENVSLPIEFIELNNAITESQIEKLAVDENKKGWGHIYTNGNLNYPRIGKYPMEYWREIDKWEKGFKFAILNFT